MKCLELTLQPNKDGWAEIDWLSCMHFGHTSHEREMSLALLDEACNIPGRSLWSLGDNQDNGTKNSPGASVYEQTHNPRGQLLLTAAIFRKAVQLGKLVVMQNSNHSGRIFKDVGFITSEEALHRLLTGDGVTKNDWKLVERYAVGGFKGKDKEKAAKVIADLADELPEGGRKKPYWGGWQALTEVTVGNQKYVIHSMHGEGAGVAHASALQAVVKQQEIGHADIFVRGHHHKRIIADAQIASFTGHGRDAELRRVGYMTTGCMLGYHNSYGEAKGYRPTCPGMVRLHLSAKEHVFRMSM